MPKLGMEMTEALLVRFLVDDGAAVAKGDPIYEIETDKITNEVEAPAAGRLRRIAAEQETYPVGEAIAELLEVPSF